MVWLSRGALFVILGAMFLALGAGNALAERRIALVVGNSKYNDSNLALARSASDAEDIATALKALGYEVQVAVDATVRQMDAALRRFGDFASTADVALFFYAGHAMAPII